MTTEECTPRHIAEEKRLIEVCSAACRYHDEGKKIPIEWIREIRDLASSILVITPQKVDERRKVAQMYEKILQSRY